MLPKDFENFELRLKTLREQSHEDFKRAQSIFDNRYYQRLHEVFPRDILGVKKYISGSFLIEYIDVIHDNTQPNIEEIFKKSVEKSIATTPLSAKRKQSLCEHIFSLSKVSETLRDFFDVNDSVVRDPFFALVEDFSMDGDISREEFLLLQESYAGKGDFLTALDTLPKRIHDMFYSHIEMTLSNNYDEKRNDFESEYSSELAALKSRGVNIEPVVIFVSKGFYKTPGKYRKFEHKNRRMRRTFKLALLKLLRIKLGNIDAELILKRFESGESFEDMFLLIFELMEIVNEKAEAAEIFSLLGVQDEVQDEVFTAEENKKKILKGESVVMKIANIFSKGNPYKDSDESCDSMLATYLSGDTDVVGEEVYFNREEQHAGVYAQADSSDEDQSENEEDEEVDYDSISPAVAYEMLEHKFHKAEEEKRKAFLTGDYDRIDEFNERLLSIQTKLEKLANIGVGESQHSV